MIVRAVLASAARSLGQDERRSDTLAIAWVAAQPWARADRGFEADAA